MQRKRIIGAVCCGALLCLPVSGLLGQTPAKQPPAATTTAQPGIPLQTGPITLPATPLLPVVLTLRAWLSYPTALIGVNGAGSERFGISTGLNANTVSPATAARLQLPEGKNKVRVNILDKQAEAVETTLKSMQIGLLKLENIPVAQVDVVSLVSRAPHPDAPVGWLGVPFLSAFHVTLDMSRRMCILDKPTTKMPAGSITVPMTLQDGHIFVPMTLPKSKPVQAMLDSGSVLTLIPASLGEKLKLKPLEVVKLGSGEKAVQASLILAPQVAVGKAECKSLKVAYLSADASPTLGRETAVLGLDFLSRYRVVLNFAAKKVGFVPLNVPESEPPVKPDVKGPPRNQPNTPRQLGQTPPK